MKVATRAMVIMKGELVKDLYRLVGSRLTGGGGAAVGKKKRSVEVELERKKEDVVTNISKEASNNGLKLQEERKEH